MSEKNRRICSSLFMLLFVWQVAFLCSGYLSQSDQINKQSAYFVEEVQEDDEINVAQFTEGFSDSDVQQLIEEEHKLINSDFFHFDIINPTPDNWIQESSSPSHFQNPYSPPDGII